MSAEKWHRDLWLDAIWEDQDLKPNERVVAYAFARYAGKGDTSWCSWSELRNRTGIRSKDAIWRAVRGLREKGWLAQVDPARQHRSPVYRLRSPLDGPPDVVHTPVDNEDTEVRETDPSEVRETDLRNAEVRENVARGPAFCKQGSGKREAREVIDRSNERTDLPRDPARCPSGARAAPKSNVASLMCSPCRAVGRHFVLAADCREHNPKRTEEEAAA